MNYFKLAAFALLAAPLSATYTYYHPADQLTSVNPSDWQANGTVTTGSSGLAITDPNGGSLISKVSSPTLANYEVRATLNLTASGGTYVLYLRASQDALSGSSVYSGSYYSFEITPTFAGSNCSANVGMWKVVSGAATLLGTTTIPCHNGMQVHAVALSDFMFYVDGTLYAWFSDSTLATGQPGIGGYGMPAANSIFEVDLGRYDSTLPNPVMAQTVGTSSFPDHVDMHWEGASDDQDGIGIGGYWVVRDGTAWMMAQSPGFTDEAVTPSSTHTYTIFAMDLHGNLSPGTTVTVTTAPAGAIDMRRIGVHPLGIYWGGMGEQLDIRSGNLNFTVPMLKAMGRGGWGVGFALSYNSQQWRQDGAGIWAFGEDVGYGYGWQLMAGSITPYWSNFFTLDHYIFTDSTGARYRLDVNHNGIWTSTEGVYVSYDAANQKLYFPDGSFWAMGCASAGMEMDAGSMYPTQMEDTNGNQVLIRYAAGIGIPWTNSSARIVEIEDVRAPQAGGATYSFAYSAYNYDGVAPHLLSITPHAPTAEAASFSYTTQNLYDPFGNGSYGTTSMLTTMSSSGVNRPHTLVYGGAGELTSVTYDFGGSLRWGYTTYTYKGGRSQREVQNRYLRKSSSPADPETAHQIRWDTAGSVNDSTHGWTALDDLGASTTKSWNFFGDGNGPALSGLAHTHSEYVTSQPSTYLLYEVYEWLLDTNGARYQSATNTTLDYNTVNAVTTRTEQTLDIYGNPTTTRVYDYAAGNSPGGLLRTTTNNYATGQNYSSRYITNRLGETWVANGSGQAARVVSNAYDQYVVMPDTPGVRQHDSAYNSSVTYRGNITSQTTPSGTVTHGYDITGNTTTVQSGTGVVQLSATSATNYYLPSTVTPNGSSNLSSSFQFNGAMELTSAAMPNGATASATYDGSGQPQTTTSVYGAVTTYLYNYNGTASTVTATTVSDSGTHWVRSTMDGLGRTTMVEKGTGPTTNPTTLSVTESAYAPCACSPTGKVIRVSQPHAANSTPIWTTYTYDALGRTLTMVKPDGSTTHYAYSGNKTTVTDAAGNWKIFTTDGAGNLTQVQEPNPAGGTIITSYSYNAMGKLTQVNMAGQIRTFIYDQGGQGSMLLSASNPENGTVQYTYNADGTLATKHDAKGQTIQYGYDNYKRLTQMTRPDGQDNYYYDTYSVSGFTSQYAWGRLAAVTFQGVNPATNQGTSSFTNLYSYSVAGQVSAKRLRLWRSGITPQAATLDLEADYTYDNEGRMKTLTYPGGQVFTYSYDGMGQASSLAQTAGDRTMYGLNGGQPPPYPVTVASGASHGPAGELTQFVGSEGWSTVWQEIRGYNSLLQLTSIMYSGYPSQTFSYTYPDGGNIGKISKQSESSSGEEVQYAYDALGRLISAETTAQSQGAPWGYSYQYAVNGTLAGKTVTKGSPTAGGPYWGTTDANGNLTGTTSWTATYDAANRLTSISEVEFYGYDPSNKRVQKIQPNGDDYNEYITFYGASGETLCTYQLIRYGSSPYYNTDGRCNLYFAGQRLARWGNNSGFSLVKLDRLGTEGGANYYPWGEEKVTTAQNTEKFATYYRDATTGLDYADQRYYSSIMGRFLTVDSGMADLTRPQSFNRYAYSWNDSVNGYDPTGQLTACVGSEGINDASNPCAIGLPVNLGWNWYIPGTVAEWDDEHGKPGPHKGYALLPNGSANTSTVDWDVVFGLAPTPNAVDVWTLKGLLEYLYKNPALVLLALSIQSTSTDDVLPPDKSRCPDKDHFNDPTKPPHEGWVWKGGTGSVPGDSRGAWVSPSGYESLHPNLDHPDPKGPHWDYRDPTKTFWDCWPDGTITRRQNQ